jgi:RNA polymerase sigma factor (sigma-70 family)
LDEFEQRIIDLLPSLRRFARALAGQVADADDLVQAAVERALARRRQWQAGTSLEAWMFKIVKNAWIDEARARSRRGKVVDADADGDAVADPAGGAGTDTQLAIRAAVAALPEDQRIAVALILIEGLSYQEAADVLETPVGTVTSRLGRGRAALQAQLANLG